MHPEIYKKTAIFASNFTATSLNSSYGWYKAPRETTAIPMAHCLVVRSIQKITLFLSFFMLVQCGGGDNPDEDRYAEETQIEQQLSGHHFKVLDNDLSLTVSTHQLSGHGTVSFIKPLDKINVAQNYSIVFQLEDEGRVTLITNADEKLENGVAILIQRKKDETQLTAGIAAGDDEADVSQEFADVDGSSPISLSIDVHNDHGGFAHIIIWQATTGSQWKKLVDTSLLDEGAGQYWGISLADAQVTQIDIAEPRDKH